VTVEVAVLIGVVVLAMVAMAIYLMRGAQGNIKGQADSLGSQFSATQGWTSGTSSNSTTNETAVEIRQGQNQTSNYSQTMF
jgi:hypothetical protein